MLEPLELDPGARLGHCGATSYGVSDCKGGSQGSFGLDFRHGPSSVIWNRAARRCLERCAGCERCNFVSVSLQHKDCSWYHNCDPKSLQLTPQGFRTYRANVPVAEPPVCFAAGSTKPLASPPAGAEHRLHERVLWLRSIRMSNAFETVAVLLSALQITMREPTVAWRLLWQAPYSDVRHVAPHVRLMSDLIVGRWWRNGTCVPDGPDDFDAEVPRTDFDPSPRCYSWDIALSFAPLFSTYGSAVNKLPYAAIGALRAVIYGRRATPLPPPPFDAGADKAEAVLLQRQRGILGGEGRSLLNEAAELIPHSAVPSLSYA